MSGLERDLAARSREQLIDTVARDERALVRWEIVSVISSVLVAEWAVLALDECANLRSPCRLDSRAR